ncbi:MAG: hypothetical protein HQM16_05440 [Deltaproteobacteria bacterium]|nr:hypothetical protein [Deltaproteobacteria bacterium]
MAVTARLTTVALTTISQHALPVVVQHLEAQPVGTVIQTKDIPGSLDADAVRRCTVPELEENLFHLRYSAQNHPATRALVQSPAPRWHGPSVFASRWVTRLSSAVTATGMALATGAGWELAIPALLLGTAELIHLRATKRLTQPQRALGTLIDEVKARHAAVRADSNAMAAYYCKNPREFLDLIKHKLYPYFTVAIKEKEERIEKLNSEIAELKQSQSAISARSYPDDITRTQAAQIIKDCETQIKAREILIARIKEEIKTINKIIEGLSILAGRTVAAIKVMEQAQTAAEFLKAQAERVAQMGGRVLDADDANDQQNIQLQRVIGQFVSLLDSFRVQMTVDAEMARVTGEAPETSPAHLRQAIETAEGIIDEAIPKTGQNPLVVTIDNLPSGGTFELAGITEHDDTYDPAVYCLSGEMDIKHRHYNLLEPYDKRSVISHLLMAGPAGIPALKQIIASETDPEMSDSLTIPKIITGDLPIESPETNALLKSNSIELTELARVCGRHPCSRLNHILRSILTKVNDRNLCHYEAAKSLSVTGDSQERKIFGDYIRTSHGSQPWRLQPVAWIHTLGRWGYTGAINTLKEYSVEHMTQGYDTGVHHALIEAWSQKGREELKKHLAHLLKGDKDTQLIATQNLWRLPGAETHDKLVSIALKETDDAFKIAVLYSAIKLEGEISDVVGIMDVDKDPKIRSLAVMLIQYLQHVGENSDEEMSRLRQTLLHFRNLKFNTPGKINASDWLLLIELIKRLPPNEAVRELASMVQSGKTDVWRHIQQITEALIDLSKHGSADWDWAYTTALEIVYRARDCGINRYFGLIALDQMDEIAEAKSQEKIMSIDDPKQREIVAQQEEEQKQRRLAVRQKKEQRF